jgi:hypothetical protein
MLLFVGLKNLERGLLIRKLFPNLGSMSVQTNLLITKFKILANYNKVIILG